MGHANVVTIFSFSKIYKKYDVSIEESTNIVGFSQGGYVDKKLIIYN